MAKKAAAQAGKSKEEKTYYIVNPSGAIHAVSYEHARWRLSQVGYRTATAEEVAEYKARGGNQAHNNPIAAPWSPEPVEIPEPEEAE